MFFSQHHWADALETRRWNPIPSLSLWLWTSRYLWFLLVKTTSRNSETIPASRGVLGWHDPSLWVFSGWICEWNRRCGPCTSFTESRQLKEVLWITINKIFELGLSPNHQIAITWLVSSPIIIYPICHPICHSTISQCQILIGSWNPVVYIYICTVYIYISLDICVYIYTYIPMIFHLCSLSFWRCQHRWFFPQWQVWLWSSRWLPGDVESGFIKS
jgi:hypothetical protein